MGQTLVRLRGRELQLRVGGTVSNLHIFLSNLFRNSNDATFDKNILAAFFSSLLLPRVSVADTALLLLCYTLPLPYFFFYLSPFSAMPNCSFIHQHSLTHSLICSVTPSSITRAFPSSTMGCLRGPPQEIAILVQVIQNSATRVPKSKA